MEREWESLHKQAGLGGLQDPVQSEDIIPF